MRRPLISNFLVLRDTVARATCSSECGCGKDDEYSSVSGDEDNEPVSIDHFREYFIFKLFCKREEKLLKTKE